VKILLTLLIASLVIPVAFSKDKKNYLAKKDKIVKKKKAKKKRYMRYPARVNPHWEDTKLREMLKDIYE